MPRERVVSKMFDNEDFGYRKITIERPQKLNFKVSAERIARLDNETGFKSLATSAKKDPAICAREIEAGQQRQNESANSSAPSARPTARTSTGTATNSSPTSESSTGNTKCA